MSTTTNTILSTMEWAKRLNFNRHSGLGTSLEPAKTNANIVMQTILGAPFAWRWNRIITGFITIAGIQDYFLFNWTPNFILQSTDSAFFAIMLVDANGNCQRATTIGTTGTSIPSFNNTLGGTTTDGSVVWTNLGQIPSNVFSTYSFGWVETASVQDPVTSQWRELEAKMDLGLDSTETLLRTRPRFISAQIDDGNGNIVFRVMSVPDKAYPIVITLQKKSPIFSSLNQFWSPIPDEYAHIYNWGFLALFFLFSDDPRFALANQKFVTSLLATNSGLTQTERNVFLNNWQYVTGQPIENSIRMQQGGQARGA